jgi:hypothetical protein
MNKNRKINKKKFGISSPALLLFVVLLTIGYIFMVVIFARMSAINVEDVRKEAEAGNELIRIYISIDRVYENGTIENKTMIVIINQWGKTSIIDYFVVEGWNGKIISKGEFNPPLILEAGEEIEKDPSDFGLNDIGYKDFGFFKEHIRCINLHTKQGNVFSSAYQPVKVGTFTFHYYYVNITQTITTQTFSTTANKTYKLIIESHGPFDFSNYVNPKDSPYNYHIEGVDDYGQSFSWNIIDGNAIMYEEHHDGNYTYPAGILVNEWVRGGVRAGGYMYVWDNAHKCSEGPYERVELYPSRWDLWEIDENGNEIRLVYQKSGDSITFTMDTNYKLKRYFKANCYAYVPPPVTTTTKPPPIDVPLYMDFPFFAKDGKLQEDGTLYFSGAIFISQEGYLVEWLSPEQVSGEKQWLVKKDKNPNVEPLFDTTKPQKYLKFLVEIWWKGNSPPDASITIRIWYKLKPA